MIPIITTVGGIILFAIVLDIRNKKIKNYRNHVSHSATKPGEETNFTMGDNRYSSGGD